MGRFTLRLPETLHSELENRAQQEGVSLNQFIIYALTRQIGTAYTIEVLPERMVKEQQAEYQILLDKLGGSEIGTDELAQAKAFLAERDVVEPESALSEEMLDRIRAKFGA